MIHRCCLNLIGKATGVVVDVRHGDGDLTRRRQPLRVPGLYSDDDVLRHDAVVDVIVYRKRQLVPGVDVVEALAVVTRQEVVGQSVDLVEVVGVDRAQPQDASRFSRLKKKDTDTTRIMMTLVREHSATVVSAR